MLSKKEVAAQLRAASTQLQKLASENSDLTIERDALLLKVAELSTPADEKETTEVALQKEATETFSFRGGNGFGSQADDLPIMSSDMSAEQRLDLILSGESPGDYN